MAEQTSEEVTVDVTARATLTFTAAQWAAIERMASDNRCSVEDVLTEESGLWWRMFTDECDDITVEVDHG